MSALPRWGALALAVVMPAAGLLAGCAGSGERLTNMVTPYRPEVVQGNVVTREQADALKPGMSRQQVREILGTPLMTSLFHANRWEYVFTIKRPGVDPQVRKLTVFFNGDSFALAEGDEMPSESEFVASLQGMKGKPKVPQLEATEAQLAKYPARQNDDSAEASNSNLPPAAASYPPLESR